jgi:hypothetical protein
VKGSSRSAKDSVVFTNQLKRDFRSRIRALQQEGKLDLNSAVIAMLGAGKDSMASSSARYFLRLFIRSERIYQDLTLAREQNTSPGLCIREWCDIDIGMEFRTFVHGSSLTAMSQYDYIIVSNDLNNATKREEIISALQQYWRTLVHPALNPEGTDRFQSYIVDFAIDCTGKPWVIELNPFEVNTTLISSA